MVIKVVDGRVVNNRYWVFAGGLTNVNVVTTVTDTQTGAFKTYTNPQGTAFQPIQGTSAFATPALDRYRASQPCPWEILAAQCRLGGEVSAKTADLPRLP